MRKRDGPMKRETRAQIISYRMFRSRRLFPAQGKVNVKESKVARTIKGLVKYRGTFIPKECIKSHMHSWLVHFQRISSFLSKGEGVWWHQTNKAYCLMDGDQQSVTKAEGPHLLHYRTTTKMQLETVKRTHWKAILHSGTTLPTPYVQHYDTDGIPTDRTVFPKAATGNPTTNTPQPSAVSIPLLEMFVGILVSFMIHNTQYMSNSSVRCMMGKCKL